jgi:hypothetical protein
VNIPVQDLHISDRNVSEQNLISYFSYPSHCGWIWRRCLIWMLKYIFTQTDPNLSHAADREGPPQGSDYSAAPAPCSVSATSSRATTSAEVTTPP